MRSPSPFFQTALNNEKQEVQLDKNFEAKEFAEEKKDNHGASTGSRTAQTRGVNRLSSPPK